MEEEPIRNKTEEEPIRNKIRRPVSVGTTMGPDEPVAALDDEEDYETIRIIFEKGIMTFGRRFCRSSAADVQEAWPAMEYALNERGISCALDLDRCFITLYDRWGVDPAVSDKARRCLQLLSLRVSASQALRVLDGVPCEIIRTGFQIKGLCRRRRITMDEYQKRKKLLRTLSEQEDIKELTSCEIYIRPRVDLVAAIGPVAGLKIVKKFVSDCILHKVPPADMVRRIKMKTQVYNGLKKLSLGCE